MIDASFDSRTSRSAAVSGAYQYDTGQRIRLHGLPSPDELAEQDDFLSGDVVTVQAQYSFVGDSQTEARLAFWDEDNFVWTAAVPDVYMARCEDVHVYVYVSYGASEESSRAKTCYEAVFRPISRPAPSAQVTPDQVSAWDQLVAEVNLTLASMNTAISNANAATANTNQAIEDAKTATQNAQSAAEQIDGMTVTAQTLSYNSSATASITDTGSGKHIVFGIPQGKPGVFTLNGKTPDESGAVNLTAADVGAYSGVQVLQATLPASGWSAGTVGAYDVVVSVTGARNTDEYDADVDMSAATAANGEAILEAWALVGRVYVGDNYISAHAYGDKPEVDIPIRLRRIV